MKKRLVITGIGFFNWLGYDKECLWQAIEKGFAVPESYSKVAEQNTSSKSAFGIEGKWEPNDLIENRTLKRLADFSKILCCASKFALEDAGISKDNEGYVPEKVGSIVNTVHGPMNVTFDYLDDLLTTGPATARPILFQQTVNNVACGQVAIQHKLKGVSSTIVGASSLLYAAELLQKGTADAILVGGHEELHPYIYAAYDHEKMLAKKTEKPEQARPFSEDANGFVLGEGAGVLILETLESAKKRNAHIYAELVEESAVTDENFVRKYNEFDQETSTGIERAMKLTLEKSGIDKDQIGFVSLLANGCKDVDDSEKKALDTVLGNSDSLGLVAHKAFLGETLGANEMFAVITALLCMEKNTVPGLSYLNGNQHSTKNADCCIVNSLFTGGNINSVLLKKYQEE